MEGVTINSNDIIKSLEYSTAAYRDIQPYTPHTLITIIDNKKSGVNCYLRSSGDTLWITFRGTDSPREWKSNFKFNKKIIPYDETNPKIRVHKGFLTAYKTRGVRDKILGAITDPVRHVKINGHSRGAALAVLCAVDIQYNFPDRDIEAVLFGCPRVGNSAFIKSYNQRVDKTVRVENGNDIVTKVPLILMGYRHVGAPMHVGTPRLPVIFSPNDHYPHKYYSSLLDKLLTR